MGGSRGTRILGVVKCAQSVEDIDEELWSGLAPESRFHSGPGILKATQVVMVNHLNTAVVPDAFLKCAPT